MNDKTSRFELNIGADQLPALSVSSAVATGGMITGNGTWAADSTSFGPFGPFLPSQPDEELEPATLQHVFRLVSASPWAITPEMLETIKAIVARRIAGVRLEGEELASAIAAGDELRAAGRGRARTRRQGAVALLSLYGVIAPKASMVDNVSGPSGTGLDAFSQSLDAAVNDPEVASIVIDVNSPGGTVDMVPETAQRIRDARAVKPVYAVANTDAGSAAYWLASQATELLATPSGSVGSIGVYSAHQDLSAMHEAEGRKVTLVSAGKFKTEMSPFGPLSEDAKAAMQEVVNDYYDWFVGDVAKGRGVRTTTVKAGYGEGRMVVAKRALAEGMIDGIATLEDTIARALRGGPVAKRTGASAEPVTFPEDHHDAETAEGIPLDALPYLDL